MVNLLQRGCIFNILEINSIISEIREYRALLHLKYTKYLNYVLKPNILNNFKDVYHI